MTRAHFPRILAALGCGARCRFGCVGSRCAASLPIIDGRLLLPGLTAPVTIERDAAGVPTITGAARVDLARALGYLHGQDDSSRWT